MYKIPLLFLSLVNNTAATQKAILDAVESDDIELLQEELATFQDDINFKACSYTPLHVALKNKLKNKENSSKIIKALIKAGAQFNAKDFCGAIEQANTAAINLLMNVKCKNFQVDPDFLKEVTDKSLERYNRLGKLEVKLKEECEKTGGDGFFAGIAAFKCGWNKGRLKGRFGSIEMAQAAFKQVHDNLLSFPQKVALKKDRAMEFISYALWTLSYSDLRKACLICLVHDFNPKLEELTEYFSVISSNPLLCALKDKDLLKVKLIMSICPDLLDIPDSSNQTPLNWITSNSEILDLFKQLL